MTGHFRVWKCFISWQWWWLHGCVYFSKLTYTFIVVHFIVCELHYNTVDLNRKTGEDFHVWVG